MNPLSILQIIIAALLIVTILLQQRGSGIGAAFGSNDTVYTTKRGAEKIIFRTTVVLATALIVLSLIRVLA